MKKLPLLSLGLLLAGHSYAQQIPEKSEINVGVFYGNKIYSSYNRKINGSFEGLEINYRKNINYIQPKFFRYWEIGIYNTDLTRLMFGRDTTTRGLFGAGYGIVTGVGMNLLTSGDFKITLTPQLSMLYNSGVNPVVTKHINLDSRILLRIDYNIIELTCGSSYLPTSLNKPQNYFNKIWLGIGVTQKL